MNDAPKTKDQLIRELEAMRRRGADQETTGIDGLLETERLRIVGEMYRAVLDFDSEWEYWLGPDGSIVYISPSCKRITGYSVEEFKGNPGLLQEIVHPDDRLKIANHFGEPRREPSSFTFRITTREGREQWIGRRCQPIYDEDGTCRGLRACNRNIMDRVPAIEELVRSQMAAERLSMEMAILAEIGRLTSSTLNIQEIYERFATEARNLISFDRVSITLKRSDGDTYLVAYVSGLDIPGRRPGDVIPMAGSISECVIRSRKSLLILTTGLQDMAVRFPSLTQTATIEGGILSIMTVPLISRDTAIGTLHFRSKKENAYSAQDLCLAERIGEQIAGAIASAQLYAQLKETETSLRETLDQLEMRVRERTFELEEVNTALRVLLKKGEEAQNIVGENLQSNIQQLVMPFLTKLKVAQADKQNLACLNILETNLNDIVSPFINQLSFAYRNLTPKEIQVAALIRQGRKSKEIAEVLGISAGTVVTHRNNIRKKLKLRLKDANLRSHLISII